MPLSQDSFHIRPELPLQGYPGGGYQGLAVQGEGRLEHKQASHCPCSVLDIHKVFSSPCHLICKVEESKDYLIGFALFCFTNEEPGLKGVKACLAGDRGESRL